MSASLATSCTRWRVYSPQCAEEVLPRFSSQDFRQEDLGKPVLDTVLHPGSLLYMPRGEAVLSGCFAALHVQPYVTNKVTYDDLQCWLSWLSL